MLRYLALSAALFLSACGGSGSPAPQARAAVPVSSLYFIGNSITWHAPSPEAGWAGDWGMAASAIDKDYVHLTAAALGLPLVRANFSRLETEPAAHLGEIAALAAQSTSATITVIELGDNATDLPAFAAAYISLLDSLHAGRLVCLSTWWKSLPKDASIKQACEAHGGAYVYIGDIFPTRQDDVGRYANSAVDGHPHDWSMARISERITAAVH